ncbi:MAG: DEAD/DEAH box helicase [Candidatus Aenigmarchaeota archaeon]|nr:DEAD/DEAH box helicase [Candidatus Aenigmarchaeota archaeon]
MKFKDLKISKEITSELDKHGIVELTKVQERVIPLIFKKKDVIVQSETGSGKTIGFAVPTIEDIKPAKRVQVLVITPTRELAKQVAVEYIKFSKRKGLRTAIVYGGVSINDQIQQVRSADIVVGTPGRLLDLLRRKVLNLYDSRYLVIDEADRLLDMGFIKDINTIISYMPKKRHNLMFSATINSRVLGLAKRYLNDPVKVILKNVLKRGILKQYYYNVKERDKTFLLMRLLKKERGLTLVFCNTKRKTKIVAYTLRKNGIKADCLNGDMTQSAREKTLEKFSKGIIDVLVATDVASRGLHVEDITHIFNYDLHDEIDSYTHRIGRTARNGKRGTAIILLSGRDHPKMQKIMRKYGEHIEPRKA